MDEFKDWINRITPENFQEHRGVLRGFGLFLFPLDTIRQLAEPDDNGYHDDRV